MADNKEADLIGEYDDSRLIALIKEGAEGIGTDVDDDRAGALVKYANMLRERNKVMNLTNILDDRGVALLHYVDSMTIIKHIEAEMKAAGRRDLTLIDVGTGAGFPGIPLKIMLPDIKVTLLDSLRKRLNFLDDVCAELDLKGIRTAHSRAEDTGKDKSHRERYDIATARAVASLPVLCEYCLPFVKVGGVFLAMKGHSEEETARSEAALRELGGKIEKTEEFCLPGTDIERSVIVIRKTHHTPARYPRQAGKPSKSPIV